jgi:hypothetical protein
MTSMQFSLQTLLLCFVVVAAAVGLCDAWGILVAAVVLGVAGYLRIAKDRSKAWWNLFVVILVLSCGGLFLSSITPIGSREASRSSCCRNNQFQIALALLNYETDHGHLPPAYIADASGKPMHSWRLLILPYLDRKDLYDAYDFNEPWDGPRNRRLASTVLSIFTCPSHRNAKNPSLTNYLAVVGPGTAWPGEKTTTTAEISAADGCSSTLMLVELPDSDINWMEPRDLSFDELCNKMTPEKRRMLFDAHSHRSVVTFADGRSAVFSNRFLEKNVAAMLTKDGGERIDLENDPGSDADPDSIVAPEWRISISLLVLAGTTLLIIYRPLPGNENRPRESKLDEIRAHNAGAASASTDNDVGPPPI